GGERLPGPVPFGPVGTVPAGRGGGGGRPGSGVPDMPDLLEPADASRRGRDLAISTQQSAISNGQSQLVVTSPLPAGKPRLLFEQVSKWYGPVIGVNQVTLELRGGITGLVGPNGAGKSTLMRLATGQLRPDLGTVQVCGHDAWSAEAKCHVGACPDVDA